MRSTSNLDICIAIQKNVHQNTLCLGLRTHLSSGVSVACIRRHKRHFIPNAENSFRFLLNIKRLYPCYGQ